MKPNVINEGVKYGIIGGLIFLLINFGTWGLFSTSTYVTALSISSFVPYVIIILIIVGLKLRKNNGDVLSYQEALKFAFVAYIVVALIEAICNYTLYNLVDHDLTAKVLEITKEKTLKMMEKFGATDSQREDAIKKMDSESKQTNFKTVFLGFGLALIWNFVKSLLIALVIRKEEKFAD